MTEVNVFGIEAGLKAVEDSIREQGDAKVNLFAYRAEDLILERRLLQQLENLYILKKIGVASYMVYPRRPSQKQKRYPDTKKGVEHKAAISRIERGPVREIRKSQKKRGVKK